LFGKTRTIRNVAKRTARTRLAVEGLEDRLVPATVNFNAAQSLLQLSGHVTGAYTHVTGAYTSPGSDVMSVVLDNSDSISAADVSKLNAAAGSPNAFWYFSFGVLEFHTSTVKNMTLTDTGNDVVELDSTAVPGNLSVTGGAIALR